MKRFSILLVFLFCCSLSGFCGNYWDQFWTQILSSGKGPQGHRTSVLLQCSTENDTLYVSLRLQKKDLPQNGDTYVLEGEDGNSIKCVISEEYGKKTSNHAYTYAWPISAEQMQPMLAPKAFYLLHDGNRYDYKLGGLAKKGIINQSQHINKKFLNRERHHVVPSSGSYPSWRD